MNREDFKENLKIATMLIGLFIIIAVPVAVIAYQFSYTFTATVESEEAKAYLDAACTTEAPATYDFGSITSGTTVTVWIKNVGTVTVDVALTIIETDCTVTPSWTATTLTAGQIQQLDMTITTTATPGTSVSWNLDIDSNKTP